MDTAPSPAPPARARLAWSAAILLAGAATAALAQARGLAARLPFDPPPELGGRRFLAVGDAADAVRLWSAAGVRGRRLVVLTGQWARPRNPQTHPLTAEEQALVRERGDLAVLDASTALYAAARTGIARNIEVVMPPAALARRLAEVAGRKELIPEAHGFRITYDGLERRFSAPRGFTPPRETVLVLVEPTWFAEGAPADPGAWLSSLALSSDLVLVALSDPTATEAQRAAAAAYARAAGATQPGAAP